MDSHTNQNPIYRYYAVAFIDVLGQKSHFVGNEKIRLDNNAKKLADIHKNTVEFIEGLRSEFQTFFSPSSDQSKSSSMSESQKQTFLEMRKSAISTYKFSDSFLAYTPLQGEKYGCNSVNGVYKVLIACGAIMIYALSSKKAVRAAIDVGYGTTLSNGEVYGPVSYQVYELESKFAKYPRIVIGKELIEFLNYLTTGEQQFPGQTDHDIKVCKDMSALCLKMIIKDADGQYILDYLGEEFSKIHEGEPFRQHPVIRDAYKFVEDEYSARKSSGDSKLALRYYLLLSYFKSKLES